MKQSTQDLEIKAIDTKLLIEFEILCKKKNSNFRKVLLEFMEKSVLKGFEDGVISKQDIDNYKVEIEEY